MRISPTVLLLALAWFNLPQATANSATPAPSGLVWRVRGEWSRDGSDAPLHRADLIAAGDLLRAGAGPGEHSVLLLLPDGQRLFFECSSMQDCGRGFRVPALLRPPGTFEAGFLATIAVTLRTSTTAQELSAEDLPSNSQLGRLVEGVARLDGSTVVLNEEVGSIPAGEYQVTWQAVSTPGPKRSQAYGKRAASSLVVPVGRGGLYEIQLRDALQNARLDILLLATPAPQGFQNQLSVARRQLTEWNEMNPGWPTDALLRVYLMSMALKAQGK